MGGIFVSYRRQDSAGHARALYDRLRERFRQRVFMDVEGIEPGVDFVEVIENAVGNCEVLLALIGREWSDIADEKGARRLDDPHDFIRLEVATALSRNVIVVPVLLEGAAMPNAGELPGDIAKLARRQAIELRDNRWDADVDALLQRLDKVLAQEQGAVAARRDAQGRAEDVQPAARNADAVGPSAQTTSVQPEPQTVARAASTQSVRSTVFHQGARDTGAGSSNKAHPQTNTTKLRPLYLALGGIALVVAGAVGYLMQGPGKVSVPNVVGSTLETATESLRAHGLVVGETARKRSRDAVPDTVLDQAPNAGRQLARGEAVKLLLAERAPLVVPQSVDKPLEAARAELTAAGLTVGKVTQESTDRAKPGTVLRMQPGPGSEIAAQTGSVDVVIAAAPEPKPVATLRVPGVVGKSIAEARALIAAAGFSVGRVATETTDRAPAESVLAQNPLAGAEVTSEKAQVDLRIAIAKPAAPTPPPVVAQPAPAPPAADSSAKIDPTPKPQSQDVARQQRTLRLVYGGEQSRAQAESLAAYFRQLGWTIESVAAGAAPGTRVQYGSDEQRALAESVANRASWWLGQQGRPNVSFPLARAGKSQDGAPMTLWLSEPASAVASAPAPSAAPAPAPSPNPKAAGPRASGDAAIRVGAGLSIAGGGESSGRDADVTLDQRVDPTQTQWFLTPQNRARIAQVRAATRDECAQASYYDVPIPTRQLRNGSLICVRSANGAFAVLQVKRVPNYGHYQLDVGYVIW